jgi:hypothetical protein
MHRVGVEHLLRYFDLRVMSTFGQILIEAVVVAGPSTVIRALSQSSLDKQMSARLLAGNLRNRRLGYCRLGARERMS